MIPGIGLKVAAGSLITVGTAGSSLLLIKNQPKNLREKMINEKVELLNTDSSSNAHSSEWDQIAQRYESPENNWKIDDLNLAGENQNRSSNIVKLKQKCQELLETEINNPKFLENKALVENWCTRPSKGEFNKSELDS